MVDLFRSKTGATVIAEFEHIWPYVNGRHEPCVRCGKPYGPNAGSCTVIISTTGPTEQEYYRD